jgi:hypothetical protein
MEYVRATVAERRVLAVVAIAVAPGMGCVVEERIALMLRMIAGAP